MTTTAVGRERSGRRGRRDPGTLWQPCSACGPDCLPGPGRTPRVRRTRQAARLAALAGALLAGVALLVVLPTLPMAGRHAAARHWARAVLAALGVSLVRSGRIPDRRALLVANHISWLDILAVLAVAPARLLAKHEVRRWPLIGALAATGGTIFIRRDRPRALPATVAQVAAALRAGAVVAVFPEGTTWCGAPTGAARCGGAGFFRPAMFQAAIDAAVPVVPITLSYRAGGSGHWVTTAAAFLGRDSLWTSLRRVVAVPGLVVSLTAADPVRPDATVGRRALADRAEFAVHRAPARPLSQFSGSAQRIRRAAAHDGAHGGTADRGASSRRGGRSQHFGTALRQSALRRLRRRHGDQRQRGG